MFIEIDGNLYNSINISSVKEVEETVDSSTVYKVITTFKNGAQFIEEYDNKSDADEELNKILVSGSSGGGGDMSNYYTKSEINQLDESLLNSAVGTFTMSKSGSTDVGTNSTHRLNFSSYTPGEYVFYNYSTMSDLYYSVITSGSNTSEGNFSTGRNTYMFKLKMILDVTEGIASYDAETTIGYITFYDFSDYSEVTYRLFTTSQNLIATDTMSSLAGASELANAIKSVTSMPTASSTYNNKIYQYKGTTNQNYTKGYFYICDNSSGSYAWHQINVQPSSSGGQGGGGQTEYVTDSSGYPYPPSTMWSTSEYNSFNWTKNTAEFKEGYSEMISIAFQVGMNNKLYVDMSYNYMSTMIDYTSFTIPNLTVKIYGTNDTELTSISLGDTTFEWNSTKNMFFCNVSDVAFDYIMSGTTVYAKLFYGGNEESGIVDASKYIGISGTTAKFKYDSIKTDIESKGFMQMYYAPNSLEWNVFYSGNNFSGAIIPLYGSCGFYVEAFIGNKMSDPSDFELVLLVHPNNYAVYKIIVTPGNTVNAYYIQFQSVSNSGN